MKIFLSFLFSLLYLQSFAQLTASISTYSDVTCIGNCDGTATVSVTGGQAPYTYSWNSAPIQNTITATGLCVGTYICTVTDALSATDTAVVTINQTLQLNISINIFKNDSCGMCVGEGMVTASGGTPPYEYLWLMSGDSAQTSTNVCAGYNDVLVTDALSCVGFDTITVGNDTTGCGPTQYGTISGTVYADVNQNCVQDVGEPGLSNILLKTSPGIHYASTDTNGNYTFNSLPYGTYNINQVLSNPIGAFCPGGSLTNLTINSSTPNLNGQNFADTVSSGQDIEITTFAMGIVPGFVATYYISYHSNSINPLSGSLYFVPDDSLSYISASTPPSSISGDTLFWNYTNLQFNETRWISVDLQVPANVNLLGDTMNSCAAIFPIIGDNNPSNNMVCDSGVVVGAYDPNDKRVVPEGSGPNGNIGITETEMLYKIRFQNTGTFPATNVVVVDTLSDKLDVSSLRNVVTSHPFTYNISGQGVVTFEFINIMLPDSGLDEPGSHGAIQFTIDQRSTNTYGTVIENTAEIYFDFNPAIVTNTVINTIAAPTAIEEQLFSMDASGNIYPNPVKDRLYFKTSYAIDRLMILDVTGKVMKEMKSLGQSVNVEDLASGIYFIRFIGKNQGSTHKFVKQ